LFTYAKRTTAPGPQFFDICDGSVPLRPFKLLYDQSSYLPVIEYEPNYRGCVILTIHDPRLIEFLGKLEESNQLFAETLEKSDYYVCTRPLRDTIAVRIRVAKDVSIVEAQTDRVLTVADLRRGQRVRVVVRPFLWSIRSTTGMTLEATNICVTSQPDMQFAWTPHSVPSSTLST
jgi:hypothetical protein